MWCNIDKSKFPIIKISFNASKQIEAEFDDFLKEWEALYDTKQYFYFIFDTRKLSSLNIKYAHKMSSFIKKLKKREHQYLLGSIIIVKNKYIRFLLNIVFSITRPVADAFLFSNHTDTMICEDIEGIYSAKNFTDVINDYKNSFSVIKSRKKNDTIANDTIANDTIANNTISNDTISNDTISNDTITNDTIANDTIANNTIANNTIANKPNLNIDNDIKEAEITQVNISQFNY